MSCCGQSWCDQVWCDQVWCDPILASKVLGTFVRDRLRRAARFELRKVHRKVASRGGDGFPSVRDGGMVRRLRSHRCMGSAL